MKDNKVKYFNSPDTNIYKKGDNLYGFGLAKEEIENQGYAILLEGYLDVIAAHQSGVKNSVATLGTALTINQALLIKSITSNVVICFDGDKAGMETSFKTASILKDVGCNIVISHIKNNLDSDEFIRKNGRESFIKDVIAPAKSVNDTFIDYYKKEYDLKNVNDRFCYVHKVLNELSKNNIESQKELLQTLGTKINVPLNNIHEVIERR